jgi:spermidine/putrescine ABC transporter ATP-binding subunit
MSAEAVHLDGVTKRYGALTAVDGLSLTIGRGEMVTLLGPSGCGKTTILRMIAGFVRPTSGTVSIAGTPVNNIPPHKRQVGLVFQNYALFPHMTVADNVGFGLKMRGIAKQAARPRIDAALEKVRLLERRDAYPRQLSGGQQQRTALARALVIQPDILLLDEPFGALDRELRQHMQSEMRQLQRSLGISTLLVTHDQEEALTLSDRIVVMNAGKVEQAGTPADIFERPATAFVANFMGRMNLLKGRIKPRSDSRGCELSLDGVETKLSMADCQVTDEGPVTVMFRPERIAAVHPHERQEAGEPRCGTLRGAVLDVSYLGAWAELKVVVSEGTGQQFTIRTSNRDDGTPPFRIGDPVDLVIPPEAAFFIK